MTETVETQCCIVGGGPAGIMAGYLFARAGVKTMVLEKHGDFLRDFRGDTVHPSTIEVMRELGLAERFLELPHQCYDKLSGDFGGKNVRIADFSALPVKYKFIAFMPQWHFLDFLSEEAKKLPAFSLYMNCEGKDLIEEGGRVVGVKALKDGKEIHIRAALTIGADGRHSIIRTASGFAVKNIGAPIDVLWFRISRDQAPHEDVLLHAGTDHFIVTIDRETYWQCAYVIAKNSVEKVRNEGLDALKASIGKTAPSLMPHLDDLGSWNDVKLLTVAVDRLEKWSRPGLLFIGDSAHAMSPIGGVGINLAIQDAVAAANLLSGKLAQGKLSDTDLDQVRQRRLFPTRMTQFVQIQTQNLILAPIIQGRNRKVRPPFFLRIVSHVPFLQRRLARLFGLGVRPEHVRSPNRNAYPDQGTGAAPT
ncbi:MAG TPA: FAD-dependent oxidoreductase [Rhizobiaceae bacterium]|nr:FAD-dependent oxidoreductase [Rhizobiaceae bacterium]